MNDGARHEQLETQIAQWRAFLRCRRAVHGADVEELELHLRDQVADLVESGLDEDEAFLVAVKRMGNLDALSREFAREHSKRLWKQLVVAPAGNAGEPAGARREMPVVIGLAIAAAAAIKAPVLFGFDDLDADAPFYLRNLSFFVLPLLSAYFLWKRGTAGAWPWLALTFGAAAVVVNVFPFVPEGDTEVLTILHLPIALWLAIGVTYAGGGW